MSLYKQTNSDHWYISVTVNGKRVRRSSGTADKREAQRIHDALKADLWHQKSLGYSWHDACIAWLTHEERDKSDRYRLRNTTIPNIGLHELTAQIIQQHLPKHPATYNRTVNLITAILNLAKRQGYIQTIPILERKKVDQTRIRWLTAAEWDRLYAELPDHLKPLAAFSIATGLRQRNATHLEWSQVDLRRKIAWIHADQAKAGKPIKIPLSDDAVKVLRGQIGKHESLVFPYKRKVGDEYIYHPLEKIKGAWGKALKRARIKDFRWHDLRHTWATWHIQSGTPLEVLQQLGGWATFSMVLRYAHLAPDHLAVYANNSKPVNNVQDIVIAGHSGGHTK